jgi:hypothetical protein
MLPRVRIIGREWPRKRAVVERAALTVAVGAFFLAGYLGWDSRGTPRGSISKPQRWRDIIR